MDYTDIQIRQISTEEEIQTVLYAYCSYLPNLASRIKQIPELSHKLKQHGTVLVAVNRNKIIGFAAFYANNRIERTGYLSLIAVDKSARGQHIGSRLLDKVIEISKFSGMLLMLLEVRKDNNSAIKFYENKGFRLIDRNTQNNVQMIKEL